MAVTVYTTPTCAFCRQVKLFLQRQGVPFTERDITTEPGAAEELVRLSGQQGVPVTVIDGRVIVGYDQQALQAALAEARRPRLGAAVADAGSHGGGEGAYVGRVRPDGAAGVAGLAVGDVIVSFAGRPVRSAVHLEQLVAGVQPGTEIPVTYRRGEQTLRTSLRF